MPRQRKEVPEVGVTCFVFFIHTEMDAIFQPIKKSDTYQIKLFWYGRAQPALFGCHYIYFCYIIFIIYALRVSIFMTSPLGVAVGLLSI